MKLHTKILIGMVVGLLLGLAFGPNGLLMPRDGLLLGDGVKIVEAPMSPQVVPASVMLDAADIVAEDPAQPGWIKVRWRVTPQLLLMQKKKFKDLKGLELVQPDMTYEGWVKEEAPQVTRVSTLGRRMIGWTEWLGSIFLGLIKMVVVPLVFCSLLVGVASLGDLKKLGSLGIKTMAYFTATTVVALLIALGLANAIKPGEFMSQEDRLALMSAYTAGASKTVGDAAAAPSLLDQVVGVIPTNPFKALAGGDMLQVIFFALMCGIALTMLDTKRAKKVVDVVDVANDAMVMLVHIAMKLAPVGVAVLLFKVVGTTGTSVLAALGVYAVVVVLGLVLHLGLVYGGVVTFGARLSFPRFLGAMRAAMMLAFSTSSSSATLPVTKECVEQNLNVSPQVSSFILPLGATVNMDGTALYQGVAAVFIAQIYGIELSFADQLTIVVTATLASVGAAGVPGAGMVTLALVLTAIGVPTEGLALILGVDRLLDMCRTTVNVVGDATAAALVGRMEGNDLRILSVEQDARDPRRGFEGRVSSATHAIPTEPDSHIGEPSGAAEGKMNGDSAPDEPAGASDQEGAPPSSAGSNPSASSTPS